MNEAILYVWCVYEDAMVNTQAVYTIQAQYTATKSKL